MWRRGRRNGHDSVDSSSGQPLDEELIALRSILDPAAFAPLYRRYLSEILALCTRRLADRADVEDATAEIFRKAFAKRDTFHGGSFRKWLYTIAINTLRDHADRPTPSTELFETFADPAPGPEELALRAVSDDEVRRALARLPDDWQLVVEMRNQGFPCAEVAAAVGRDADWVRLTHHRALERLARDLGVTRQRRSRRG
jgi:RNA polymerase sigma factor (sigma-70 family)